MHRMNIVLFAVVLAAHLTNIVFHLLRGRPTGAEPMGTPWTIIPTPTRNTVVSAMLVFLRAVIDIISISVLRCTYYVIVHPVPFVIH